MKNRRLITFALIGGTLIFLYFLSGWYVNKSFREEHKRFLQVLLKMPEKEVLALLGPPLRAYAAETAPKNYYVSGYEYKKRIISNKVMIFMEGDAICYVYLDKNGLVEDIFIGGS